MKAYKGFNKDMTCRGFQFEEGKEYVEETAKLCESGFHACEMPLDVFKYYSPSESEYHVVELDDVTGECSDDTKRVGKRIKIGAKLDVAGICKAQIEYVKKHTTTKNTDEKMATAGDAGVATAGYKGVATTGDAGVATAGNSGVAAAGDAGVATTGNSGVATAGDAGVATAGYKGVATTGNSGVAAAGDAGVATTGNSGVATAGYKGVATTGYKGVATTGNSGVATAGDAGVATARGSVSVGKFGCATVRGNNVKAKGGLGAVLTICEENKVGFDIKWIKTIVIDGEMYVPDVWYGFHDGEIEEVSE